jgi:uncharacterized protein (DUF1800 family)
MRSYSFISSRSLLSAVRSAFLGFLLFTCAVSPYSRAHASTASVQLTAKDADGTNTGTARLGVQVILEANLVGVNGARSWGINGAGTLTPGGSGNGWAEYMPPQTMPGNQNVKITVWMTANPSINATYNLTLINPKPVLNGSSPTQVPAGTTVSTTLYGSGFVPGAVVLVNGAAVSTTYKSPTTLVAQIGVSAGSSGHVSVQAKNPTPGGGTGPAFSMSIATLTIDATDPDGTNTGTARLGVPVNLSTVDTDVPLPGIVWNLTGAGTLTWGGTNNVNATYTPPQVMPSNPSVTITVYTYSFPAFTKSYRMTLINPIPTVASATPTQLMTGGTQTVTLTGSGFVSGTTVTYNGTNLPTTYGGYNKATVQVPVAINAPAGNVTLQVQNSTPGGGGGTKFTENVGIRLATIAGVYPLLLPAGATTSVTVSGSGFLPGIVILVNGAAVPTTYQSATSVVARIQVPANATGSYTLRGQNPGDAVGNEFEQAISAPISETGAARLLDQTTFGPTTGLIQHVQSEGATAWLSEQFLQPQTVLPVIPMAFPSYCSDAEECTESEWWQTALTGSDQLRQRVAFALGEMFVISSDTVTGQGVDNYANLLATDAFGNWYTIMHDVTVSPAMGIYLNMLDSAKPTGTLIANENFARENMQLFNIGLDLLNQDGTLQLDAHGNPIPAYSQAQVQAFARAFTGWTFANANGSTPSYLTTMPNYYHPLVYLEQYHDENSKALLNGTVLPAGQNAQQDLDGALTNVFEHPNVPPFVCKQLIQHLVKSNPSSDYVSRVADVFINDGNNVRGDMQAVLTAIFTDPEARAGDNGQQESDGHLREPLLWLTAVMRGLGYVNVDSNDYYDYLSNYTTTLNEVPFKSSSVFNFFPPSYVIPDTTLPAPEFALENTGSVTDRLNLANELVWNDIQGFNVDLSTSSPLGTILVTEGPTALVNALSRLFLYKTMDSETSVAITNEIKMAPYTDAEQQLRLAIYLVITSSEYKIAH